MKRDFLRYAGQFLAYAALAVFLGYLSAFPRYTHTEPDMAMIRLSFSHAGDAVSECRKLSQDELNKLPPNMRRPTSCPRGRVPLLIELSLDGKVMLQKELQPSGLASDGASTAYHGIMVAPGTYRLQLRMRDSRREKGFDWHFDESIQVLPKQNFVIDFRPETGGFRVL